MKNLSNDNASSSDRDVKILIGTPLKPLTEDTKSKFRDSRDVRHGDAGMTNQNLLVTENHAERNKTRARRTTKTI